MKSGDDGVKSKLHSVESWPRRFPKEMIVRSPSSVDFPRTRTEGSSALDDLRKKLARVGGSNTSLNSSSPQSNLEPAFSDAGSPRLAPSPFYPSPRPSSPSASEDRNLSDSIKTLKAEPQSHKTESSLERKITRLTPSGVQIGPSSPATVATDNSMAMGTMDIDTRYANDDDMISGVMSPASTSFGRGVPKSNFTPQRFGSTYGMFY
jgi:hypothetical protein